MQKKAGRLIAAMLCILMLCTACSEKKESPFTPLEDPSSASSGSTEGQHPFVSSSTVPVNGGSVSSSEPESTPEPPAASSAPSEPPASASSSAASSGAAPQTPASSSRHATVRADGGLNLRATASQSGQKLLTIPDGTALECTEWQNGWTKTTYSGQTGYVSATYLLYHATVRADGGLRLRQGAGESFERLLTIPDGTVIVCMEQKDGWIKTTYEEKTGYVSQEYVRVKATVTAGPGLNLRDAPKEDGNKLTTIPNGTSIDCIGNPEDGWAKVVYNGYSGYVSATYLTFA